MSLLTTSQLAAIQKVGEEGMTATVSIFPAVYDSGLDDDDHPHGSDLNYATTASATVKGWLVGRWDNARGADVGDIDTTTVYRLRIPVGTDIEPGWNVQISGNQYAVIDAGTDQTWPEWLTCIVRRSK